MIAPIKAANPFAALDTRQAALAAARTTTVGILLGALQNALHLWHMTHGGAEAAGRALERVSGSPPTAEMQAMQQGSLTISGGLIFLQLALAIIQWRKPNQILPILFLILVGLALATTGPAFIFGLRYAAEGHETTPIWISVGGMVLTILAFVAHITGLRGARRLSKFRRSDVDPDAFG